MLSQYCYVILQNGLSMDLAFTVVMPYQYFYQYFTDLNPTSLKPGQLVQSLNTSLYTSIIVKKKLTSNAPTNLKSLS